MRELAPQTKDGGYSRPQYTFTGQIGDPEFPVRSVPCTRAPVHSTVSAVGNNAPYVHVCSTVAAPHLTGHAVVSRPLVETVTYSVPGPASCQHLVEKANLVWVAYHFCTRGLLMLHLHRYIFCGKRRLREGQVESGRYHVYLGNACPWCHRVMLALVLRGLLPHISVTNAVDDAERASRGGWVFDTPEPVFGARDLRHAAA